MGCCLGRRDQEVGEAVAVATPLQPAREDPAPGRRPHSLLGTGRGTISGLGTISGEGIPCDSAEELPVQRAV